MVREYKALLITDEYTKACQARRAGRYVVLSLPFAPQDAPQAGQEPSAEEFPYALEHAQEVPDAYLDKLLLRFEHKPWPILQTRRCCVREITPEDVDALYEIYAEPSITAYMENLYDDPEEERAYTQEYIRCHYGLYEFGMWIVEERGTGQILGRAGLDMVEGRELPQLGFIIRKDCQRQGYAQEVCSAILQYAHAELGMRQIEARCHPDNAASVGLLEKLGFTCAERGEEQLIFCRITAKEEVPVSM